MPMPYKDPEAKRAWRVANRDKVAKHKRDFIERNPRYWVAHREKQKLANRVMRTFAANIEAYQRATATTLNKHSRHRLKLRDNVIEFLGGRCEWCGLDNPICLEVDHITPIQRRTNGILNWSSLTFYRSILRGDETNAQLLCANCHTIKTRLGGEHTLTPEQVPFDPWATQTASNDNVRFETVCPQRSNAA
ncbi:hypothetical protein [Bradyrhizobium sp. SZCCHNR3118]|uniref:HNH endonuclease n=1 Tax=Bradyrhizobium sp. SZCCHNR3118 TaxID=3057468 RepID=UPI002916367C|nr:hypothetical protein [Bradyrhizobium sp. SZCCHNR3118]